MAERGIALWCMVQYCYNEWMPYDLSQLVCFEQLCTLVWKGKSIFHHYPCLTVSSTNTQGLMIADGYESVSPYVSLSHSILSFPLCSSHALTWSHAPSFPSPLTIFGQNGFHDNQENGGLSFAKSNLKTDWFKSPESRIYVRLLGWCSLCLCSKTGRPLWCSGARFMTVQKLFWLEKVLCHHYKVTLGTAGHPGGKIPGLFCSAAVGCFAYTCKWKSLINKYGFGLQTSEDDSAYFILTDFSYATG